MNVLLLSNSAPNYHYFFNHLAKCFHADGHTIVVAVDSEYSRIENKLDAMGFDVYEFSKYFETHTINEQILHRYAEFNLNYALLSDFERAEIYGIWGRKREDFFEKLKSALLCYFENIFINHKIDIVLYENVSNIFSYFALFVAQKNNAKYLGLGCARLPGRFSISDDPINDNATEIIFAKIRSGEVTIDNNLNNWCHEYISNIENIVPDYMKSNGLDKINIFEKYFKLNKLKKIKKLLGHFFKSSYYNFQIGNPLINSINQFKRNVYRKIKVSYLKSRYDEGIQGEQFILYPIHFHPESSTSIMSGTYLDEYEVIRNIAFNLPQGTKLYVKDHISAWGYPSLEFYKKIKKLPNVRLLGPHEKTKYLIKKSRAVITLTSTVGYEAS